MAKEIHPYIGTHFDSSKSYSYLILGTFPPNVEIRKNKNSLVDYFYGNKGSLWKIIGAIYPEFNFEKGNRSDLVINMKAWQEKYNVGITDVLVSLTRKDIKSSADSDFILDYSDYNNSLKNYIMNNLSTIKKILFTSSNTCHSAFELFKVIMGDDITQLKDKLVSDLPSPSGSSNVALLNVNNEQTLGLHKGLYDFVCKERQYINFFKERWELKKLNKTNNLKNKLPSSPKGIINEYKIWAYKNVLPKPTKK